MTRDRPPLANASETLDPARPAPEAVAADAPGAPAEPYAELLFHPRLARVGDRTGRWPAVGLRLGRREPAFRSADGREAPLDDPFVSRDQATIRWLPHALAFEVEPAAGARQPVSVVSLDAGRRSPLAGPARLPAGAVIALGDRALVRLGLGPPRADGEDAMGLLGESAAVRTLRARVRVAAGFREGVLLLGETGVGKELVARALHRAGGAAGAFVALNMAGLDAGTVSSELFGHVRGAFTGAHQPRRGAFEAARKGTLFLDEVGDLAPELQARLLRVLEDRTFTPLGGAAPQPLECRVVAATHRALADEVEAGRFRRDLFERLRALTLPVPPLRDRREDVPGLFVGFLAELAARHPALSALWRDDAPAEAPVPMAFFEELMRRPWPGNVRELRNAATAAAAATLLAGRFDAGDAPARTAPPPAAGAATAAGDSAEDARIREALAACRGNVRAAAERLGTSRAQLYRWMAARGVDPSGFRGG